MSVDPENPPHIALEWGWLDESERRDVLRWAARLIRQQSDQILREA